MDRLNSSGTGSREIKLAEVVRFLSGTWKGMVGGAVFGGVIGLTYLAFVSQIYEAYTIVRMAQVPALSAGGAYEKLSIEAPGLLVDRLKVPSIYPDEVIESCGWHAHLTGEELLRRVSFTARNSEGVVSISIRADAPSTAKKCLAAVFEMIHNLQVTESQSIIDRLQRQLDDLQERMTDSREHIASLAKTSSNLVAYLAARDNLNYLWTRMDEVTEAVDLHTETKMITPIYVSADPVFPRRPLQLMIIAVMGGVLAGFLVVSIRGFR